VLVLGLELARSWRVTLPLLINPSTAAVMASRFSDLGCLVGSVFKELVNERTCFAYDLFIHGYVLSKKYKLYNKL
jgi:hypothetical protein